MIFIPGIVLQVISKSKPHVFLVQLYARWLPILLKGSKYGHTLKTYVIFMQAILPNTMDPHRTLYGINCKIIKCTDKEGIGMVGSSLGCSSDFNHKFWPV